MFIFCKSVKKKQVKPSKWDSDQTISFYGREETENSTYTIVSKILVMAWVVEIRSNFSNTLVRFDASLTFKENMGPLFEKIQCKTR